jgi:nucleotide-binding universal stress UspA family protein
MNRILFAVDLTEPPAVTRQVEDVVRGMGAQLLVVHVCPSADAATFTTMDPMTGMGGFSFEAYDPQVEARVFESEGEAFEQFLKERFCCPLEASLLRGDAAEAVLEAADQLNADLVILGKRRHSRLEKLLIGSVAGEIVERCPKPTLLVPIPER